MFVAVASLLAYFFAPKGENQTYVIASFGPFFKFHAALLLKSLSIQAPRIAHQCLGETHHLVLTRVPQAKDRERKISYLRVSWLIFVPGDDRIWRSTLILSFASCYLMWGSYTAPSSPLPLPKFHTTQAHISSCLYFAFDTYSITVRIEFS